MADIDTCLAKLLLLLLLLLMLSFSETFCDGTDSVKFTSHSPLVTRLRAGNTRSFPFSSLVPSTSLLTAALSATLTFFKVYELRKSKLTICNEKVFSALKRGGKVVFELSVLGRSEIEHMCIYVLKR